MLCTMDLVTDVLCCVFYVVDTSWVDDLWWCDTCIVYVLSSFFSQLHNEKGGVEFYRKFRNWNHLTLCSLQQVNCPEVKRRNWCRIVESVKSDFGDSVYGLINFRLILIRNYVFLILVNLFLFQKIAQPFSLIQGGHVGKWHIFKCHVVTVRGNLVVSVFSSFYTVSQT